jgi:transcriptional regulator with XRE-family HTH domain
MKKNRNGFHIKVGEAIKKMRKERDLTIQDAERETGRTQNHIRNIESGVISPSIETLKDVACFLGTFAHDIVREAESGDRPPRKPKKVKKNVRLIKKGDLQICHTCKKSTGDPAIMQTITTEDEVKDTSFCSFECYSKHDPFGASHLRKTYRENKSPVIVVNTVARLEDEI